MADYQSDRRSVLSPQRCPVNAMAKEWSGTSLETTSADTGQILHGQIDLSVDLLQLIFYNNEVQPTTESNCSSIFIYFRKNKFS